MAATGFRCCRGDAVYAVRQASECPQVDPEFGRVVRDAWESGMIALQVAAERAGRNRHR